MPGKILAMDRFFTCLLAGKAALKLVNYKLSEVIQDMNANPSTFLECFTKALLQYTNLDSETVGGRQLFMTHFFFLSATLTLRLNLDIWRKAP